MKGLNYHNLYKIHTNLYVIIEILFSILKNVYILFYFRLLRKTYNRKKINISTERCYILGSGSSINEIDDAMWNDIKHNFSIGFNYSILLNHNPNLHFIELAEFDRGLLNKCLKRKSTETIFIAKGLTSLKKINWLKNVIPSIIKNKDILFLKEINLASQNNKILNASTSTYLKSSIFNGYSAQSRASISLLILEALKLGFTEIILCGIDLGGPYFFEKHYDISTGQNETSLLTMIRKNDQLNIYDIIYHINKILKNNNVKLFTNSKQSKLSNFLTVFELRTVDE